MVYSDDTLMTLITARQARITMHISIRCSCVNQLINAGMCRRHHRMPSACRGGLQYEWSGDPAETFSLLNLKKDDFIKRYEVVADDRILPSGDRAACEFRGNAMLHSMTAAERALLGKEMVFLSLFWSHTHRALLLAYMFACIQNLDTAVLCMQ